MKNVTHKKATFLRQLALTLLVALLAAAQTAQAQDSYPEYITEVKLIGGAYKTLSAENVKNSYPDWEVIDYDLNKGCKKGSIDIFLIYKKSSRANTCGGYISDFIVSDVKDPGNTMTYNNKTYYLCDFDGVDDFINKKGDLNCKAGGKYVYLYYTRENFSDTKQVVSGISFDESNKECVQLVCTTCNSSGNISIVNADFNRGAEPGSCPNIYMHLTTATKTNRPSADPVMASGLTYNGLPQPLLSISNSNTGTMMYRLGTSGDFSSTIPTATTAGNYTVQYYAEGNVYGNQSETKTKTVSIAKFTSNQITTTAALNLTYNGSAQNLITAYSATYGTVQYSLDGNNYSTSIPQGTNAKDYTVYYRVVGNDNYNGVAGSTTATIKKAASSVSKAPTATNPTYNGTAQYLVTAGTASGGTIYYKLGSNGTYSANRPTATEPGDYTVYYYVKGDANHNDSNVKSVSAKIRNVWGVDDNADGSADHPYIISTTYELDLLATNVNGGNDYKDAHFKLGKDITYDKTKENNFTAIGTDQNSFRGLFDGAGKSISGIRINKPDDGYQGLFGQIVNAKVENVKLADAVIIGYGPTGGIVGWNNTGSTISNCIVADDVYINAGKQYAYFVGGISGRNDGTIEKCVSSVTLSHSGDDNRYLGGISGSNYSTLRDNLVINAKIPVLSIGNYGAIVGSKENNATLENNYYYNFTIGENVVATGVGCGTRTTPSDIENNNGASPAVIISAANGITITKAENTIPYGDKIYAGVGKTVTLTITDANSSSYYTYGDDSYLTKNDQGIYQFVVPDAKDIVFSGIKAIPELGDIVISASDGIAIHPPVSNAIVKDGKIYAEAGQVVTLALTDDNIPEGYILNGYAYAENQDLAKTDDGNFTFTVPNANVTISRDAKDVWGVADDADGSATSPYIITSTDGLDLLATNVNNGKSYENAHFKLGENITYDNTKENNFTAIGNFYNHFQGTFNGNGYTISGIRINKNGYSEDDSYQGLFGYLGYGANVHEVKLSDAIITGYGYTGGIAGYNSYGTISGCTIDKVEIGVAQSNAWYHGGIVGYNSYGSTLRGNLAIDVNISALSSHNSYGVIAGENYNGTLENNYYYNCSANETKEGIGVGSENEGQYDLSDAGSNYGAAPAHAITVPEGVTLSDNCIKYSGKYYTAAGVKVEVTVKGYENFSVTVESAVVTETNGKYVFTMPAAYVTISVEGTQVEKEIINKGALKIVETVKGTIATLDGAYTGGDGFALTKDIEVDEVTFSRAFTNGTTSTIILPFDIPAGKYSGGKFYELTSFDTDKGEWVANATIVSDVKAHTPYIFVPEGSTFTITGPVTLKAIEGVSASVTEGNWTFTGVYQRKRWGADDGNNKDYCFAANKTDDINIGDFVKIGTYVQIKPFRCYLTYNDGTSKAATILPENIKVRIVDATASVIDNPADPVVEHNDDFETPVSEIVPSANVKVWSYDKTIYISAAAGSNYRIIDVNGRALATGVTATDRDEIRLGNRSGIVIVIINGKTFKLKY